jgi:hypothetical protein
MLLKMAKVEVNDSVGKFCYEGKTREKVSVYR